MDLAAGSVLSFAYWHLVFGLMSAADGVLYLLFLWSFSYLLDVIDVWEDKLVYKNGCSGNRPIVVALSEIESVETAQTSMQSRFGLSTIQIKRVKQRDLGFVLKDADQFRIAICGAT